MMGDLPTSWTAFFIVPYVLTPGVFSAILYVVLKSLKGKELKWLRNVYHFTGYLTVSLVLVGLLLTPMGFERRWFNAVFGWILVILGPVSFLVTSRLGPEKSWKLTKKGVWYLVLLTLFWMAFLATIEVI